MSDEPEKMPLFLRNAQPKHKEEAPPEDKESLFLTPAQLSERWGWTQQTLYQQRRMGKGPEYIKLGESKRSHIRYLLESVEEYERTHKVGGTIEREETKQDAQETDDKDA